MNWASHGERTTLHLESQRYLQAEWNKRAPRVGPRNNYAKRWCRIRYQIFLVGSRSSQENDRSRIEAINSELAESETDQDLSSNLREMKREVDKALLLPESFVQEFAKARSEALLTWQKARQESDFSLFQSSLENLVEMTRKKIEYLPKKDTPYDTLLDEYEVGMTVADYDELFEGLRVRLVSTFG